MTELSKETVKRIKEEAKAFSAKYDGIDKFGDLEHGYIVGAQNEAQRAMIVEAEKEKTIDKQEETINSYYDLNNSLGDKIRELTSERDAYKEVFGDIDFVLMQLEDYLHGKEGTAITLMRGKIQSVLNQFNNTENKKQ